MLNKLLSVILSVIIMNDRQYLFDTDRVTRLINDNSKLISIPLSTLTRKKIKVIDNKNFDHKLLDLNKSWFPYLVLNGLFDGNEGDLISSRSSKCPFYKKNKIPISDFINHKIMTSFDKINKIIKEEIKKINFTQVNITELAFKLTALIIGNAILGIEDYNIISKLEHSFTRILHDLSERPQLYSLLKIIRKIPFPENIKISKDMKNINEIFTNILKNKNNSLLNEMLIHNSYEEVLNFLKFIFFAGFETTSNQLTFVIYMLSQNKDWQEEIYNEMDCIKDYKTLGNSKFLNSFIFETLRVHPIVNTSTREDDNFIYIFNTVKINEEENNDFDPYRYINKTPEIYTFQAGERQCIGKRLSLIEIQLFVVEFIRLFNIEFHNKPKIKYSITKYLAPNLKVIITKKNKKRNNVSIKPLKNKIINNIKVTYNGNKYNLSEYIFKHPGGKHILNSLNGLDITEEFNSKHFDSRYANNILDKYKNYEPSEDIFKTYQILDIKYNKIGDSFLLVEIIYDTFNFDNNLLINGNTLVFHQNNGEKSKCFSISKINKKDGIITLFMKKFENGLISSNLENLKNNYVFSFINSVYSKIKENDVLISIGSGLGPFVSYSDKCNLIAGFRGNFKNEFENNNIKNIKFANSKNNEYVYDIIDKLKINDESNIYLCGNQSFINNIINKYKFKNIYYDQW